jgi:hypothetical protein
MMSDNNDNQVVALFVALELRKREKRHLVNVVIINLFSVFLVVWWKVVEKVYGVDAEMDEVMNAVDEEMRNTENNPEEEEK